MTDERKKGSPSLDDRMYRANVLAYRRGLIEKLEAVGDEDDPLAITGPERELRLEIARAFKRALYELEALRDATGK